MKKLIYGVGINDADYHVAQSVNGKIVKCEYYARWHNMLQRCYDTKWLARYKTYEGCAVCDEWLTFSNFKRWMEQQDWRGNFLDKDIIDAAKKIYSPSTCRFVCRVTNNFLLDSKSARGDHPIGVSFHKRSGKYYAYCKNPFTKRLEHLGVFLSESSAHHAWRIRKFRLAIEVAKMQKHEEIAKGIINKYKI